MGCQGGVLAAVCSVCKPGYREAPGHVDKTASQACCNLFLEQTPPGEQQAGGRADDVMRQDSCCGPTEEVVKMW